MCDAIYHGYDIPCIQSLLELGGSARDPPPPDCKRTSKVKESIVHVDPPIVHVDHSDSIVHVDHTYRDYSRSELADLYPPLRPDLIPKTDPDLFTATLHMVLENPDYAHIIAWQPHGRAWSIWDKNLLVSIIIPAHFNNCKLESFFRNVNSWGFKRLHQEGPDRKSYYHEMFLRGKPQILYAMSRLKGKLGKRLPNKKGEPNFYDIANEYPLPVPSHEYSAAKRDHTLLNNQLTHQDNKRQKSSEGSSYQAKDNATQQYSHPQAYPMQPYPHQYYAPPPMEYSQPLLPHPGLPPYATYPAGYPPLGYPTGYQPQAPASTHPSLSASQPSAAYPNNVAYPRMPNEAPKQNLSVQMGGQPTPTNASQSQQNNQDEKDDNKEDHHPPAEDENPVDTKTVTPQPMAYGYGYPYPYPYPHPYQFVPPYAHPQPYPYPHYQLPFQGTDDSNDKPAVAVVAATKANAQQMPDNTNTSAAASCPVANTPRSTTSSSDDNNEEDSDEEIGAMIYASSKTNSTASYQH